MNAYPRYKDSGVPWLGNVPTHWIFLKLRVILTPRTQRNRSDLPLLSVVREKGVIKRNVKNKGENHNTIPEDLSNYKIVESGQFVMNKMKAWQGSYSVSSYHGIVSPAYFVFDINHVNGCFFNYSIRSKAYIPFFTQASDGVRIGQWDLNKTRMKEIPFVVPPQDEQIQISRYLDWQTSKINKFIKAKKKLITLLKEQKQNIINEAVTQGINPDAKMKDSGVSWLGVIPEHWEVRRLKSFSRINSGQVDPRAEEFNRMILIAPNHIESRTGKLLFTELANAQGAISGKYLVRKGQLLYSKIRPALRKAIIAPVDCLCSADMYGITFDRKIMSKKFALISILSDYFSKYVIDCSMRVAMPKINRDTLGITCMAIPPIDEQKTIVEYIEKETVLIDKTIDRTEREIELIQEYRTRLVSDLVTGKVDVRSVEIPDFDSVEMEQEVEGDEEAEDELITESIEE